MSKLNNLIISASKRIAEHKLAPLVASPFIMHPVLGMTGSLLHAGIASMAASYATSALLGQSHADTFGERTGIYAGYAATVMAAIAASTIAPFLTLPTIVLGLAAFYNGSVTLGKKFDDYRAQKREAAIAKAKAQIEKSLPPLYKPTPADMKAQRADNLLRQFNSNAGKFHPTHKKYLAFETKCCIRKTCKEHPAYKPRISGNR